MHTILNLLIVVVVMVDLFVYAFNPSSASQHATTSARSQRQTSGSSPHRSHLHLVPSQVPLPEGSSFVTRKSTELRQSKSSSSENPSDDKPNRNPKSKTASSPEAKRKTQSKRRGRYVYGNLPDIHWRAIPMEHLRLHPLFEALPEHVPELENMEQVRDFRQDSWQWDALHAGRCTTSQASAALGFLEPNAGEFLNVPHSWRRGGMGAYYRLSSPAISTLGEMRQALIQEQTDESVRGEDAACLSRHEHDERVWSPRQTQRYPFAAKYQIRMTADERLKRKRQVASMKQRHGMSVKMSWGNTQESTALLTALNYFERNENLVCLKEVGMCGAGLELEAAPSLLVGASPDALLCHVDGSVEVLEVKNHCPFQTARKGQKTKKKKDFYVREFNDFEDGKSKIPLLYLPQLMMEMLCVGPECKSAVMVRQTATQGALIIRLSRNDVWLDEMLYWLQRFLHDFVDKSILPETNFYWEEERYQAFLEQTKRLGESAVVLDLVPHSDIQRMLGTTPNTTTLFLD